jgi:hypothetical protein
MSCPLKIYVKICNGEDLDLVILLGFLYTTKDDSMLYIKVKHIELMGKSTSHHNFIFTHNFIFSNQICPTSIYLLQLGFCPDGYS